MDHRGYILCTYYWYTAFRARYVRSVLDIFSPRRNVKFRRSTNNFSLFVGSMVCYGPSTTCSRVPVTGTRCFEHGASTLCSTSSPLDETYRFVVLLTIISYCRFCIHLYGASTTLRVVVHGIRHRRRGIWAWTQLIRCRGFTRF